MGVPNEMSYSRPQTGSKNLTKYGLKNASFPRYRVSDFEPEKIITIVDKMIFFYNTRIFDIQLFASCDSKHGRQVSSKYLY